MKYGPKACNHHGWRRNNLALEIGNRDFGLIAGCCGGEGGVTLTNKSFKKKQGFSVKVSSIHCVKRQYAEQLPRYNAQQRFPLDLHTIVAAERLP